MEGEQRGSRKPISGVLVVVRMAEKDSEHHHCKNRTFTTLKLANESPWCVTVRLKIYTTDLNSRKKKGGFGSQLLTCYVFPCPPPPHTHTDKLYLLILICNCEIAIWPKQNDRQGAERERQLFPCPNSRMLTR